MRKQRKYPTVCMLCKSDIQDVTFHDADILNQFMSGQNKILPRRKTGACAKHQRKVASEIKRARELGILGHRGH